MAMDMIDWNIQEDGNDDNGGGYKRGGTTVDRSVTAPITFLAAGGTYTNDLASTSASGWLELTSAAYNAAAADGFHADDVGNMIHITGGTNFIVGWYQIKSVASNVATLDRPCGSVGNATDGSGRLGGPLATHGGLGYVLASGSASGETRIAGSRAWIKYSARPYEMTTNTANVATGYFQQVEAWNIPFSIMGYKTTRGEACNGTDRPVINSTNAGTIAYAFYSNDSNDEYNLVVANIIVQKNTGTLTAAFSSIGLTHLFNCKAIAAGKGFSYCRCVMCVADSCTTGFEEILAYKCTATTCATGFTNSVTAIDCLAMSGTGIGFSGASAATLYANCVAANNAGDGFDRGTTVGAMYVNCVATNNVHGFDMAERLFAMWGCYTHGNSGNAVDTLTQCDYLGPFAGTANNTAITSTPWKSPTPATSVVYTNSTKTLHKDAAFTHVSVGCWLNITAGTNMTPGSYLVATKTSNDEVVLAVAAGTGDSTDAVISLDISLNNIADGGALLRSTGVKLPSGYTVDTPDIGSVQRGHSTAAAFLETNKDEISTSCTDITAEFGVTGTAAGGGGRPEIRGGNL